MESPGGRTLAVEILAPQAARWSGRARHVVVPATTGSLGILPGRAPVVAVLAPGTVRVQDLDGDWHALEIGGGFVTVTGGTVEVLDG
ncbi:hypothetical protein C8046_02065 [Serinibacter arcticus]|uniref:ATP synthase F1 complex delta/epsilon subunit N-terminal domain-containing protein n=1 Tax=Serinibacter arcticus TaxID=1655435 RepID=A0A2U1ZRQ7_9MICO|nr:F0F1 ATP synthase subunit epsilon [Serinibacter arcticus]PWD49675.1 hypothetical protein C8046_02065 [Serinibacter arcticus]